MTFPGPAMTPLATGPGIDTDDPASLGVAETLLHEAAVCLPLPRQLLTSLRSSIRPDLEIHNTPRAEVLQRLLEPA
ncbi:hypothetical protein, partial [Nocardia sp. NPDC004260]